MENNTRLDLVLGDGARSWNRRWVFADVNEILRAWILIHELDDLCCRGEEGEKGGHEGGKKEEGGGRRTMKRVRGGKEQEQKEEEEEGEGEDGRRRRERGRRKEKGEEWPPPFFFPLLVSSSLFSFLFSFFSPPFIPFLPSSFLINLYLHVIYISAYLRWCP